MTYLTTQPDKENTMPLSRIVVLPYDGFLGVTAGSTRADDEQDILAAVAQASHLARYEDDAIPVVVVHGAAQAIETAMLAADIERVKAMVMDANKRAHLEPAG